VTPAEHAATAMRVAELLDYLTGRCAPPEYNEWVVALAERATELEREATSLTDLLNEERLARIDAEARATELERERDDLLAARQPLLDDRQAERERAERAETALREIAALDANEDAYHIARAALGETAP